MCSHISELRARATLSLLQGHAAVCCQSTQRTLAMLSNGTQWGSQQKRHGFHTAATAAARRSSDCCRSLNWLALIRTRLHPDSSYSTNSEAWQDPTQDRQIRCRSFAATSPFLPVPRPAMRHAQTAASTPPLSRSSSGDTLASMDDSMDGSSERSTPVTSASTESSNEWKLEYTGALSSTVRTLKVVSLTTATLSLIGSPLYILATMDGQYTAVKVMAASGFTCFGLFTTGLLHWFVGPYVHKLWYNTSTREYTFHEDEAKAPESIAPLQTFEVKGKVMFIDEATFENKELLGTLTPASPYDLPPEGSHPPKQQDE